MIDENLYVLCSSKVHFLIQSTRITREIHRSRQSPRIFATNNKEVTSRIFLNVIISRDTSSTSRLARYSSGEGMLGFQRPVGILEA
jgi:hypothetical protein